MSGDVPEAGGARMADDAERDIVHRSIRGGIATVGGQTVRLGLQLASTVVLARLLLPDDYGLMAMIMSVLNLLLLFKDLGLPMATIQRPELTRDEFAALFWTNTAIGVLLMGIAAGVAPLLVLFYQEPSLLLPCLSTSVIFLLGGIQAQPLALLRRHMWFGRIVLVEIGSLCIGIGAAIAIAAGGQGVWALVAMLVVQHAGLAIGFLAAAPWRPARPRVQGTRTLLRPAVVFGTHVTMFNLANYVHRNFDKVIVGWQSGAAALGLYSRSYGLVMLPLNFINAPLGGVVTSALCRVHPSPVLYRSLYCAATRVLCTITLPVIVLMILYAEEMVLLLLGERWRAAAPLFLVLSCAMILQPVGNTMGWLFISTGRPERMARWGAFTMPVFMAAFGVGVLWGAIGVATAYAIAVSALVILGMGYACRGSPVSPLEVVRAVAIPYALASLLFVIVLAAKMFLPFEGPASLAIAGGITGVFCSLTLLTGPLRRQVRAVVSAARAREPGP